MKHQIESAIQDTSDWTQARLLHDLPQFLDKYNYGRSKSLSFASKKLGAPHTLVVTSAGLRAADVTRYGYGSSTLLPSGSPADHIFVYQSFEDFSDR